jgi:hypothetical protein
MTPDIFTWPIRDWRSLDPVGFEVVAIDGDIGNVDEATTLGPGDLVVINVDAPTFGEKIVLPAGAIAAVDVDGGTLFVDRTAYEISTGPRFVEDRFGDDGFRAEVGRHYSTRRAPLKRAAGR